MPKGFFNKTEIQTASCGGTCKLDRDAVYPRAPATGRGKMRIMIIGMLPDDSSSSSLVRTLDKLGVCVPEDCWSLGSVCCQPPDGRQPTIPEIEACRPRVIDAIRTKQPRVVILLGVEAVRSVIGRSWHKELGGISRWRGWTIPDREFSAWVCPVFHPADVTEGRDGEVAELIWQQDFRRALDLLNVPLPKAPGLEVETESEAFNATVYHAMANKISVAFDYETSGLKCDRPGHFIRTVAVSDSSSTVACELEDVEEDLIAFLKHDSPKIAHNAKFEERWSRGCLGIEVNGWEWCTMLSAHVLDNRDSISSLKFQSYVQFGIVGYDDPMKKYLRTMDSNSVNQIAKAPLDELLLYNGYDAALTLALYKRQKGIE